MPQTKVSATKQSPPGRAKITMTSPNFCIPRQLPSFLRCLAGIAAVSTVTVPARTFAALPPASDVSASAAEYNFYGRGPYRADVPRPSAILGYEAGKTHTTFRDQERVINAIAEAAKDRVRVVEYGRSIEGRPLRLVLVSSPANIARLDTLRQTNLRLADTRQTLPAQASEIMQTAPVWTWVNHCIHGDETASFEAVLWTLYTLAASDAPEVTSALDKSIVVLNPVFNPDGHERFVVYYNSVALGSPERWSFEKTVPWAVRGRFNHYRFDMNRDKLAQSQVETQQETKAFLSYLPQVFADEHGQPQTYFFPPNSLPTHPAVDRARVSKWTTTFGRANAAAFDKQGWAYVNRETFDLFYPGYLDSFTTLSGAVGMTYETDGGGNLARRRDDGTLSTLGGAAARHVEAALTTVFTAAQNREALLRDFYEFRRAAILPAPKGSPRRVVFPPSDDEHRAELATLLARVGVEARQTTAPFDSASAHAYSVDGKAQAHTFPAGSLVVDLEQPQGQVARAFLEAGSNFEPDFTREQIARRERNAKRNEREPREDYEFYDITGWALPFAFGLDAYWTEDASPVAGEVVKPDASGSVALGTKLTGVIGGRASVAYLFPYDDDNAALLALRLLGEGFRVAAASKPITIGKQEYGRGTFVVRVGRNSETLHARIAELAQTFAVPVVSVSSAFADEKGGGLGSETIVSLRRPRIAVVADDNVDASAFGAVWHLLDKAQIPFTAVRLRSLNAEGLARYNVVILPDGGGYESAFGKSGIADLKSWMGNGGALLGLGGGGTWFADADVDITSARVVGSEGAKPADKTKVTKPTPETTPSSEITEPTSVPGAVFSARIDPTHFLGWGMTHSTLAVPVDGATFLRPSKTGTNPVSFGKGPLLLSGWEWPDDTERFLQNTAYVIDEPTGAGHALLFAQDPTFRALWPGLRRLVWSSILFGTTGSSPDIVP